MVMALADALHSLLRLPGATYSCVVERDSGRVLAEVGSGEAASGGRGRGVGGGVGAAVERSGADDWDMVASRSSPSAPNARGTWASSR